MTNWFLARRLTPTAFDAQMMELRSRTTISGADMLFSMLSSHETDRLASLCLNDALPFDQKNSPRVNASYHAEPPSAEAKRLRRMLLLLQFTFPGAPVIYYGDEAGMWGGDDPDNRKPMLWADSSFASERSFDVTGDPEAYPVAFDSSLYRYYRSLSALRASSVALQSGTMQTLQIDDVTGVYAFVRAAGAEKVFVAVNTGDNSVPVVLSYLGVPEGVRLTDPIHNVSFFTRRDNVAFVLPPRSATVLLPEHVLQSPQAVPVTRALFHAPVEPPSRRRCCFPVRRLPSVPPAVGFFWRYC